MVFTHPCRSEMVPTTTNLVVLLLLLVVFIKASNNSNTFPSSSELEELEKDHENSVERMEKDFEELNESGKDRLPETTDNNAKKENEVKISNIETKKQRVAFPLMPVERSKNIYQQPRPRRKWSNYNNPATRVIEYKHDPPPNQELKSQHMPYFRVILLILLIVNILVLVVSAIYSLKN